jgi:hypothetical protein
MLERRAKGEDRVARDDKRPKAEDRGPKGGVVHSLRLSIFGLRPSFSALRTSLFALQIAILALAASVPDARAAPQLAERTPAGALLALEIPDTAAAWRKVHALPLIPAFEQYLAGPSVSSNLDYRQFELKRGKWAAALGYALTLDELLGNVFSRCLVYATPAQDSGPPDFVLILGVKDKAKATGLLEVIDKRNREAAASSQPTTGTASLSAATGVAFEKARIGAYEVSRYRRMGRRAGETYYGLAGDRLIVASAESAFAAAAGNVPPAAGDLASNAVFQKLRSALPWDEADVVGWIDGDAIVRLGAGAHPMIGALPRLTSNEKMVLTARVLPNGLFSKTATSADPQRISPNIKPTALPSLGQFASRPLLATASGQFDPDTAIAEIKALVALSSLMETVNPSSGGIASSSLAALERATSISLEGELAPALGNEIALAINDIRTDPAAPLPLPTVDLLISLKVRDQRAMQIVMNKLETYARRRFGSREGFVDRSIGSRNLRVLATQAGDLINPAYLLMPDRLLIALNPNSIAAALERMDMKSPSLVGSPLYATMMRDAGGAENLYDYAQVDLRGFVRLVSQYIPVLSMLSPQFNGSQFQQLIDQVLVHLDMAASITTREQDVVVQYSRLLMN